jgi:hypothetical protein
MDSMFYEFIDKYNGNYELYYICKYIFYIYGITYEKLIEEYMPLICYNTKIHKYSELNKNSIAYKDKICFLSSSVIINFLPQQLIFFNI